MNYTQPEFQESLDINYPDSDSAAVVWNPPKGQPERHSVKVSNDLVVDAGLTNVRKNADQNYTATIHYAVSNYPECDLTP
ncbi:hypothetical protein [Marinobacter sp. KMM 10035]|uniref:hypothetical protein n=1 Tax=Marinobacter sp. KMM 10035 TaxID=3134034 RepID=UPI00397B0EA7